MTGPSVPHGFAVPGEGGRLLAPSAARNLGLVATRPLA